MASAHIEIEVDLPEGVSIRGYERHQGAHVFEVDFELPTRCTCSHCGREAESNVRLKNDVLAIRDRAMREGNALVAGSAARLEAAGFRTTTTVRDGAARDLILDCAAEWRPDLIVMGSHGRTGIDRLVLGSVSESIVRHAGCSVEIVRAASAGAQL